jgi:hypothetical protein
MGGVASTADEGKKGEPACLLENGCVIDNYHIKLSKVQMANLFFDLMNAKKTLTWKTVVSEKQITFRKCMDVKIDVVKLYNMQPDIEEWVRHDKATLKDCKDMELWRPNPFFHFKSHIGDLVVERECLPPRILINGGVKFNILKDRYGLTPELMVLLKYSPEDWVKLGLDEAYLDVFNERQWADIFNKLKKSEVADAIRYFQKQG